MDAKKLSQVMPTMVGIGFCAIAAVKLWAMSDAASAPDPASGRTEAALFAAAVSTDWSYITPTKIIVLMAVTCVVLLLAALMLGLMFYERFFGDIQDEADPDVLAPSPVASPARKGRNFGIRRRGI